MQLLEDKDIIDSGDMAERILALRLKVQELLSNPNNVVINSDNNAELMQEIVMLKEQITELSTGSDFADDSLKEENLLLKQKLLEIDATSKGGDEDLQDEILLLKQKLIEVNSESTENTDQLAQENRILKKKILELNSQNIANENNEEDSELKLENIMLKKQIENREKTIKELDFKLEMFKLAKNLREGAGISSKSEELKTIINEYIKEIDNSIATLNIE